MHDYKNTKVMTMNEVAEKRHTTVANARNMLMKAIPKLELGKDYFKLTHKEAASLAIKGTNNYPRGMYLVTETAYNMVFEKKKKIAPKAQVVKPQMITPKPEPNPFLDVLTADRDAYVGIIRKQSEQIDALIKLLSKTIKTPMPLPEFKEKVTAAEWYAEINAIVDKIHEKTKRDKNVILSNAYKVLDTQYGLCIDQYKREYGEIIHKKPTVLDTIFWVENEQNPSTKGLLSGVLETMYNNG